MKSERNEDVIGVPTQEQQTRSEQSVTERTWAVSKGEIIGNGVSGLVELSKEGYAIKSPWPPGSEDSLNDMRLEAQIYQHLGPHPRIIKIIDWNPEECVLTMEYMPHGTLKAYLETHTTRIPDLQRRRWVSQLAEGLEYLHSKGVFHYDFKPKNILLDSNMEARVADFGCSSLHNSRPSGGAGVRYTPQGKDISSTQYDIFALGSTIHAVMTGVDPLAGFASSRVQEKFRQHDFPEMSDFSLNEVVRACWQGSYSSVSEVRRDIDGPNSAQTSLTLTSGQP